MFYKTRSKCAASILICSAILLCSSAAGCKKGEQEATVSSPSKVTIQNSGSDTMVVLAQAWAEQYAKIKPSVSVEVSGGGSGAGIAALINGTADIANSSRPMTKQEIEMAKDNTGKEPQEYVVGYDALAIYVHKDNPLDGISIGQLAEIYGEDGTITKWSQLGIKYPGCPSDDIIRISRQSSSGTYYYLREVLLGKQGDFKLGSRDLHGSKDVVELVATTPCAIGYSGIRYATSYVKKLKVAKKDNGPPVEATVETVLDGTYPIHRPFYMYSLGRPTGETRSYLEWIHSDKAQKIAEILGYVPLPQAERAMKSASEKYPQKVKENNNQKYIGAPMMDVPDELAKENVVLQVKDGLIGPVGNRLIGKFLHHTSGEQQTDQNHGHAAQPPGESESQRSLLDNFRTEVQNQSIQPTPIASPLVLDFLGVRED